MSTFELGPIQKAWIEDLRANAHLQMQGQLGKKKATGELIGLCCLGQLELTYCRMTGVEPKWYTNPDKFIGSSLAVSYSGRNGVTTANLEDNYQKVGLKDDKGGLYGPWGNYNTLTEANDHGKSWFEIADYIEANPENVFTHPV